MSEKKPNRTPPPDKRTAPVRTHQQIANMLGVSKATIQKTEERAIHKLREGLEKDSFVRERFQLDRQKQ